MEILKPGFPQQLGKASPTTLGFPTSPHRSGDDHHQLNLLTEGVGQIRRSKVGHTGWTKPVRPINARHSVQPVATSVNTRVWRKGPSECAPQWATKSASMNPGRVSSQSANVRIGTRCLSNCPDLVVLLPCGRCWTRNWRRIRSAVAGLIPSNCSRVRSDNEPPRESRRQF